MKIERSGKRGIIVEGEELRILINPSPSVWDIDADYVVCTRAEKLKDGMRVAKESDAVLVATREVPRMDIVQVVPRDFQALGRGVWVGKLEGRLFLLVDSDEGAVLIAEKDIIKKAKDLVKKIYIGEISEFEI